MTLSRTLYAESLKLKRTIALKMVVLAPLAVVLLTLFLASQAPFSTLRRDPRRDEWMALVRVNLQFWGLLMLPLYLTLQSALLAGLNHSDNQWKALFARPVARWTIYMSKLLVVMAMTIASAVLLTCFVVMEGAILHQFDPDLRFGFPSPMGRILLQTTQMTGLAFLCLTFQHWASLRWRSFSVSVGFGIVAMVTGFAMLLAGGQYGTWPQYFPWSLPMLALARNPQNIAAVLTISGIAGLITAVAGCVDFCRREVT
jgi:lantibiotic transport system permease protein